MLETILPEKSILNDFEVTHTFSTIGERVMLLNACEVINKNGSEKLMKAVQQAIETHQPNFVVVDNITWLVF